MALTWNDIDFKTGYITINKTLDYKNSANEYVITPPKTKRSIRRVLMPNKLKETMLKYYENEKQFKNFDNKWFVFRGLEPVKSTTLQRYFEKYLPSDLKRITIHQFRHSHASVLISQGADVNIVAERLGHTPEMCLNVYSHMWESRQKEILNLIDNL